MCPSKEGLPDAAAVLGSADGTCVPALECATLSTAGPRDAVLFKAVRDPVRLRPAVPVIACTGRGVVRVATRTPAST